MSASVTLRAICSIQRGAGEVVIPAIHTFLDATRMNASTRYEGGVPAQRSR